MRLAPIVLAALVVSSIPAGATGGLGCEAKDARVDFTVDAAVTRGMGSPFLNFHATLALSMNGIPEDLRNLTLDDAITHSWLHDEEVKLQFYVERQEGEFASVDFVVETVMTEEGLYRGEYVLTAFAPPPPSSTETGELSATGEVVCYVE